MAILASERAAHILVRGDSTVNQTLTLTNLHTTKQTNTAQNILVAVYSSSMAWAYQVQSQTTRTTTKKDLMYWIQQVLTSQIYSISQTAAQAECMSAEDSPSVVVLVMLPRLAQEVL